MLEFVDREVSATIKVGAGTSLSDQATSSVKSSLTESRLPARDTSASDVFETHAITTNAKALGHPRAFVWKMGDEGLEPSHDFTGKAADRGGGDAESDASSEVMGDGNVILADDDAGLAVIVEAWPMLSADARRAVLEFVDREVGAAVTSDRAE